MTYQKLIIADATASSSYTGGSPSLSINGDTTDGWLAGDANVNHYIVFDLASLKYVKKVRLMNNINFVTNNYTNKSGSIYYSEDGVTYTLFGIWTGYSTTSQWLEVEIDKEIQARYIKITDLTNYVGNRNIVRLGEVEVYTYYEDKILLKSNDKVYSIESEEKVYDLKMTSNTTPAPYVARGSSTINATTYDYFKAFDGSSSTYWVSNAIISNININFSTSKKVNKVSLTPRGDALTQAPKDFNIEGSNDGINWTILLKVENITDWVAGPSKEFNLDKTFEYSQYRINILSNNGGKASSLAEIVYGVRELILKEIPVESIENLIQYGEETAKNFSSVLTTKNYILQDGVSEDTDGLRRQELNRKPLSIKFE